MDLTLAGMLWTECLVYLDDVIIIGQTFEDHLGNLISVLERLRGVNLKAKPLKCAFFQKQVLYLGHIVSPDGVATDPSKTENSCVAYTTKCTRSYEISWLSQLPQKIYSQICRDC